MTSLKDSEKTKYIYVVKLICKDEVITKYFKTKIALLNYISIKAVDFFTIDTLITED